MARSTFKILFYLKRQAEQNGKAPIMGRITINGTISQFSCKMSISPKLWDTKANKASGKSVVAQRINEKLENIKTNIGKQYQRICDRDSYVTAEKVKNAWLGFGDGYQLLLQTFDAYLAEFAEKRVGKDRSAPLPGRIPAIRIQTGGYTVQGIKTGVYREVRGLPLYRPGYAPRQYPYSGQETEADELYGFPERLDRFRSFRRVPHQRNLP